MSQKTTIDELQVLITANAASFNKQLQAVQRQLDGLDKNSKSNSKSFLGSMNGMKVAALAAAAAITVAMSKAIASSTRFFGDFEQNAGGAKAIFGDYAGFVQKKAWEAAHTMGMSINEYLQTANKIGAIMQGSGLAQAQSLKMTTEWMQRAADQASVMGVSTSEAMMAITGAAKGNFTMMDNIGVKMSATTLEAYALSKGIRTTFENMTEAQKIGLAYELFLERTNYAAGNFAREGATTMIGALAILRANFKNLGVMLGQAFAPMVLQVAHFVSNYLLPALQAIIPYVVAFMQVVGQAVSYVGGLIAGLFGGGAKSVQAVSDSANSAASSVKLVASAATGAGKALGGAAKEAKKLKGQLAGFDEMNVITEPQTNSGGGGGGAGGGGSVPDFNIPKPDFNPFGEMEKKVSAVAQSIKEAFGFINFEPLKKSLGGLLKALEPFKDKIGAGLAWLYEKVLKPLAKWTIEKALPTFLDAIAAALRVLDPIIEGLAIGLSLLWDNFLSHLVGFVADGALLVINAIKDLFNAIAGREGDVEILKTIAATFGVLVGLWAAFNAVLIVFKVVGAVAAVVFGVLTSPITLIVLAIAAVIAIIVLCIKHWDDICKFVSWVVDEIVKFVGDLVKKVGKFFEDLWNGIVAIFVGIGTWFKDRFTEAWNAIVNVFTGIGKWFGDRWTDIKNAFGAIGTWFKDRFNDAKKGIHDAFNGLGNWAKDRWNDITSAFSNAWQTFSDIGKNIWNGLKNGIGNIANNMKNMFTGAVDGVKKFLGIHSPSRLFMSIGGYMGEGLAIGLDDEKTNVLSSLKSLTEFTPPKLDSSLLKTPSLNSSRVSSETSGLVHPKTISLLLKIDGKDIPVNIEKIAEALNEQAFMRNSAVIDLY